METPQRLILPFLAAVVGVACLSLMDALMKSASLAAGVYTASLLRVVFASAIATPIWLSRRPKWPQSKVMKLHVERGVISAFMSTSFFYALTKLPMAEAIALSFIAPLITLYFAHLLLGERISRAAIGASLLGFGGTLVIIWGRMGRADFGEDTAWGLAALAFSALLYAYSFIVIRKQAQLAGPLEIASFHSGVGAIVHLLVAPFFFVLPGADALFNIAGSAVLTVVGAMAIAWAYARAEAQVLVPVEYTGFLSAALFGWLFFAEEVTATTLIGVVIIVAACWIAVPRSKRVATTEGANL